MEKDRCTGNDSYNAHDRCRRCGNNASSSASSEESSTSSTVESSESSSEESSAASATEEETDEMAAKNVADLIDAIYVQERNDNTDEECKAAKEAWDALTDAQKELVEAITPTRIISAAIRVTPRKTTAQRRRNRRKRAARCQLRYVLQRQSRKGYQGH